MTKKKKEDIHNGLKLLVKSSVIVLITFIFSKILGYAYRIIIARYFGPEIYGIFSLSLVIIIWVVTLSSLGFDEGVARYFSFYRGNNEKNKIRYLFRFSSRILMVSTLIAALLSFFFSDFISISILHDYKLSIFVKFFSLMIPFWVFAAYFLAIIRSFEKIKALSVIENVVQNGVRVLFLVVFIILGLNYNAIIFSFFLGILIMFLSAYFYCKFKIPEIFNEKIALNNNMKKIISKNFISYSWPILFLGTISSIFYWIDSFAIGFFKSAFEVGIYNAVIPIALLIGLTSDIFLKLFFPLITKEYSLNKINFISALSKQIGKWVLMINMPIFILIFLFPEIIITILFGPEYIVAANVLRILLVGSLVSYTFVISNNLILMTGRSRIILFDILVATVINIFLNAILIQKPFIFGLDNSLGINGAAIATTISIIALNFLFVMQAKRYTSIIPLKKEMLNILLASITPTLILLFMRKTIVINVISFVLLSLMFASIYILFLFLFKVFDKEDKMIFQSIKGKFISLRN